MKTQTRMTTTIPIKATPEYYCNEKFRYLSIDISRLTQSSCCAAKDSKIDIEWVKHNPGNLFNSPVFRQDRMMMLSGQAPDSCQTVCWVAEKQGQISRRLARKSNEFTHEQPDVEVENINLLLSDECNLTCVYCCKTFSTAWQSDLQKNGGYLSDWQDDRFKITTRDLLLSKVSQQDTMQSGPAQAILTEVVTMSYNPNFKSITMLGGEPFLNNALLSVIDKINPDSEKLIYTGLGVDTKRFTKMVQQLAGVKKLKIVISAESVGDLYEFVRHGNSWQRFQDNLACLKQHNIDHEFSMTITNLTFFGIKHFVNYVRSDRINFTLCTDPDFLSLNVLDDRTKSQTHIWVDSLPASIRNVIEHNIQITPSEQNRRNLSDYLSEFSRRRGLSLEVFPNSFREWIMS